MATFGSLPGIKVSTSGGSVTGVTVGRAQYLVLIGHGDNTNGSATPNTVQDINSRTGVDTKFGAGSDIATAYRQARANGANPNLIKAVMTSNTETTESFATSSSGTLSNTPIIEDTDQITATDTQDASDVTVNFVYEDSVPAPDSGINLNPHTGDFTAASSTDYDITYSYSDWSGALSAAEGAFGESEFGLLSPLSSAETVASSLSTTLNSMRQEYKMALGLMGAPPNSTSDDGDPTYDTGAYSDNVDDGTVFLVSPTIQTNGESILGAVAGLFAGAPTDEPIYNDAITGVLDLEQKLSRSEASDLTDSQVIPIRDRGSIRVRRNLSTSTEEDWDRDYWRRRIVDLVVATTKEVAEAVLGKINDPDTRTTAETLVEVELQDFIDDGMLVPNQSGETNTFVDVYKDGSDTIGIDLGITPYGLVKQANVELTINT